MVVSVLAAAEPVFQVDVLGRDPVVGPILELSAERVTMKTAEGPVSLATEDVVEMSLAGARGKPERTPGVWVELVDGSRLVGTDYSVRSGRARVGMAGGGVVEISTRDVVTVRLQPPTETSREEWLGIMESDVDSDLLVVRRADALDYHRGTLRDVTDEVVEFDLGGDLLPVKRTKVEGLVYYHASGRELGEMVCRIADADGSRWAAGSLALEGGELRWTTPLGVDVARPLAEVTRIDFSQGKIVYLSDLEPESMVWTPYFGPARDLPALARLFAPREDRGLEPGPLRLDGRVYGKGLALHSRTRLVYRLPGRFRQFKATVGIDDRVRPRGNVRLVIHGDDRVLLETAVAGTDPPQSIELDLKDVRRLGILVDFGEDLDVADHLDLCEARVVK